MPRLIDADAIPWFIKGEGFIPVIGKDEIDEQPTIDAVPVVRCKDCRWRHDDSSPMWLPCMERETADDWYCADGERKEQ